MSTYNTPYKSGTFDGAPLPGATTFTVAGFVPAAGDVGRFIVVTNGSAILQLREITAVAGQDITVAHAWDAAAFKNVTEVLPASGDTCAISYDVDDLIAGDADLTETGAELHINAIELLGGAYISIRDKAVRFRSGNVQIGTGGGLILGL